MQTPKARKPGTMEYTKSPDGSVEINFRVKILAGPVTIEEQSAPWKAIVLDYKWKGLRHILGGILKYID